MNDVSVLEAVLRKDRRTVFLGIIVVAALAWAYILYLAWQMQGMEMAAMGNGMAMAQVRPWTGVDFGLMFLMWAVMMTAMMVPTASPMILLFARVNRNRREQDKPYVSTGIFLVGYLIVWSGFAVLATTAQWGLGSLALLSPTMAGTSAFLGGGLLIAAGAFQWSPVKYACLSKCRTPLGFLMTEWRDGKDGALRMGLKHGFYCLGCCWVLMSLLFVLGVMNLLWIAALAVFVLIEKVSPWGHTVSRVTGVGLIGWGLYLIVAGAVV